MWWIEYMQGLTDVFKVCSEISAEMGADVVLTFPFLGIISSTRVLDAQEVAKPRVMGPAM